MTKRHTRAGWVMLALASFPVGSSSVDGADLKRLPPVESALFEASPAKPIPLANRSPVATGVTNPVWNARAAGDEGAVKLVGNSELYIPPVFVAAGSSAARTTTPSKPDTTASAEPDPFHQNPLRSASSSRATAASSTKAPASARPASFKPAVTTSQQNQETPLQPPANESLPLPPDPPATKPADSAPEMVDPGMALEYCNEDCGQDLCCSYSPCWSVRADALMLFRSDVRTIKIVEEGTGTPPRGQRNALLTTDALDPDAAWGPRITVARNWDECRNLELSYFGFQHWQSRAAFDGINGVGFSFNNIDVPFDSNYTSDFDGGQYVSATYSSEIHNAEINLVTDNRWDLNSSTGFPWFYYADFLAGVRYFNLSEQFNLESTDAGDTSNYLIDTTNYLIGGQLGIIVGTFCKPDLSWNITSKAGLFVNFAEQDTWMADNANSVLLRDFTASRQNMAFVGDTSFTLSWHLRPNLALTGGYYLLYVGGVALAPEQLDFTTTPTSGSDINTSGGAFYHGAIAGLSFTY